MEVTNPYEPPQANLKILLAILLILFVGLDLSFGTWQQEYRRVAAVFETGDKIDIVYQVDNGVAVHSNADTVITPGKRIPVFTIRGYSGIRYYRNYNYR